MSAERHPASGSHVGRKLLADGYLELTDQQNQFLDWLTGGRPEGESQEAFAKRLGVAANTLTMWKKDASFLKRWENRMRETWAHPDTLSRQLAVLNEQALGGNVKATELYWKLVDRMTPDRIETVEKSDVSELSDDQLDTLIEQRAAGEKERRLKAVT